MSEKHIGEVVQVIGPVLDIRFGHDELPALLNAIEIDHEGTKLTAEVAQQIGDNTVRCIAMNSTDGLVRGTKAVDTGEPIKVPVGEECLHDQFRWGAEALRKLYVEDMPLVVIIDSEGNNLYEEGRKEYLEAHKEN